VHSEYGIDEEEGKIDSLTFNQGVTGSRPVRPTKASKPTQKDYLGGNQRIVFRTTSTIFDTFILPVFPINCNIFAISWTYVLDDFQLLGNKTSYCC